MADVRLSERADRDLSEIYDYLEQTAGSFQAEAYHVELDRTLDLLGRFPRIGRPENEIAPGLRRFGFQQHAVYYSLEAGFILIRAVLHHAGSFRIKNRHDDGRKGPRITDEQRDTPSGSPG